MIVLDTRSRLTAIDENNNLLTARELGKVESLARVADGSVLLLHHATKNSSNSDNKGMTSARGASSLFDNSRFALYLQVAEDKEGGNIVKVNNPKNSYMAGQAPVYFKITQGLKLKVMGDPKVIIKDKELEKDIEVVVQYVARNPDIPKTDIYNAMKGEHGLLGYTRGVKAVKAALAMGQLEEVKDGKNKIISLGKNSNPNYGELQALEKELEDELGLPATNNADGTASDDVLQE